MFGSLKKLFNKNIECGDKLIGRFLYHYPARYGKFTVNRNIIVPAEYVVVIACAGRVTDVLPAGKHTLNESTLLGTYKHLKVGRFSRSGKAPTQLKLDLYFVYTKPIKFFAFYSNVPFLKKCHEFGKVRGRAGGVCTLHILEPAKFVEYLLIFNAFLSQKNVEYDIGYLIGNQINKLLEKGRFEFVNILNDKGMIASYLSEKLEAQYDKYGFRIYHVQLKSLKLNNKQQQQINKYIADQRLSEGEFAKEALSILKGGFMSFSENQSLMPSGSEVKNSVDFLESSYNMSGISVCDLCKMEYSEMFKYCPHCGKSSN